MLSAGWLTVNSRQFTVEGGEKEGGVVTSGVKGETGFPIRSGMTE
jgi:hypothetical protein